MSTGALFATVVTVILSVSAVGFAPFASRNGLDGRPTAAPHDLRSLPPTLPHSSDSLATWLPHHPLPASRLPVPDAGGPASAAWRFYVNRTIVPANDTILQGNVVNLPNALEPWAVAYDNVTDQYFVCGAGGNTVEVLSAANLSVVATISTWAPGVGSSTTAPYAAVFDATTREVFVANFYLDTVTVISDRNDSIVANVTVGRQPDAVAFDNVTGQVFAANIDTQNVSVISASTLKVVGTVPVEPFPSAVLYDPGSRQVFVGSDYTSNLTIISDRNDTVVGTLNLTAEVDGLALDPMTDTVFASVGSLGRIAVISAASDTTTGTISMPGEFPAALAYDNQTNQLFVSEWFSAAVAVLDAATYATNATVATLPSPESLVYLGGGRILIVFPYTNTLWWLSDSTDQVVLRDITGATIDDLLTSPGSGQVYAADSFSTSLDAFAPNWSLAATIPVGSGPAQLTEDPTLGELLVLDSSGANVSIVNESRDVPVGSLSVGYGPAAEAYAASSRQIFYSSYETYGVGQLMAVYDQNLSVAAAIADPNAVIGLADDPGTKQMYVEQFGASWSILPIGESTDTAASPISIDPGFGRMAYDPADAEMFVTNSGSAEVEVVADVSHSVVDRISTGSASTSLPWGIAYDPRIDAIAVVDQGLNALDIISARSNAIVATVPVGVAPTSVAYDPSSGALLVGNSGTGSISEVIQNLTPVPVPVTFHLVPSTCGSAISLNGIAEPLGSPVSLLTTNYSISVAPCPGFRFVGWSAPSGATFADTSAMTTNLTIDGAANVTATFEVPPPLLFPIYLNESGLPSGTMWSVTLAGITLSGVTPDLAFSEPNGTYAFRVEPVADYRSTPGTGNVTVADASAAQAIAFSSTVGPFTAVASESTTGSGGGGNYCVGTTGQVASSPAWINVSFHGAAANGTPPYLYTWEFGDGSPTESGPDTNHTYGSFGFWQVNLTVTDAQHRTNTAHTTVSYPAPPDPVPVCPPASLSASTWALYAVAGGAIVVGAAVVLLLRRRRPA